MAGREAQTNGRGKLESHYGSGFADCGRFELDRELEPAEFPVIVGGYEDVARIDVAMYELAVNVKKV